MKKVVRLLKSDIPFLFAFPAMLWQILFLYLPFGVLAFNSFFAVAKGAKTATFSLAHYAQLFSPIYLKVVGNSFLLAFETTIICLLIAYPVAYFVAMHIRRWRTMFVFFLILPSWMNFIVQVYAWMFLLQKGGVLSNLLYKVGLTSTPVHMLNNHISMIIGMVYCYLPFMILPLYTVLEKMDKRYLEASADLGANRFWSFVNITLPLSLSGVIVGSLLVFIPCFGEFAIPDLLGGNKASYIGSVIVDKIMAYRNWRSGAAVSIMGLLIPLALVLGVYIAYKIVVFLRSQYRFSRMGSCRVRFARTNKGRV
jgi:spermidine/putrescine transport system permease protein